MSEIQGKYYQKKISQIFHDLETGEGGLKSHEALLRLTQYGLNRLKEIRKKSLIFSFFAQFLNLLVIILFVGALMALLVGEPRDGYIILGIIVLNSIIGFIQEYKAEKILAAFKKNLPSFAKVLRDGKTKKILTTQIVPGDIVLLESGDLVPADARVIESFDLKINQLSLTGESLSQEKRAIDISEEKSLADICNMIYMGTNVAEGEGKAIVVTTGINTEFGKISQISQKVKEKPTPLQKELDYTGKITMVVATGLFIFVVALFYLLGKDIRDSFLLGIAITVAVVPEGLPAAVSVALSIGAQKMFKKKALVKKLLHVESLGSVTTICTDKTGTLTEGKMNIKDIYPDLNRLSNNQKEFYYKTLILCNNASIDSEEIGDPLEIALLEFCQRKKIDIGKIRNTNKKISVIPFSSQRKMMTVICKNSQVNSGDKLIAYSKGAPKEILDRCKISLLEKNKIIFQENEMAKKGLRIIALAYRIIKSENELQNHQVEKDLTFLGLVALEDPPREGVKEAIKICQDAQIKVFMITGDYGLTALTIAKEIGLADDKTPVATGLDLAKMDDNGLKKILERNVVFARIEPEQKLRIVKVLQEMGEVVAVTGDGVNDAPALAQADIGISMGIIGTEVAKETADMILLDDHFATIVNAISEGRRIFDNAKKFVFYVFSANSGELFVALIGILIGLPAPLIAVQILAIDLGADVLPSLALGMEKEEPGIMKNSPRSKGEKIMNPKMLKRLFFVGLLMTVLALGVYIIALYQGGWHYGLPLSENSKLYFMATASAYSALVFCQIANVFSCRSDKASALKIGLFSNPWLIYAEIISIVLLLAIMFFPPIQNLFRTSAPPTLVWILNILCFVIFFWLAEWYKKKFVMKLKPPALKFRSNRME